jgi:hypothetical protein
MEEHPITALSLIQASSFGRFTLITNTANTPQFCVLLDTVTLHWVIYVQHFRTVWWSHLHWTFHPCQRHNRMSKTLRTNHPVTRHIIPVEQTNWQCCCWNLKAHKGRTLYTTGLRMSCCIRRQVENYSLLQEFKAPEYTTAIDLKSTLYKLISSISKPTLTKFIYCFGTT